MNDFLFINNVLPVLKLLGFGVDWALVKEHHGSYHINIGDRKNWVATLKPMNQKVQHIIMSFYDDDTATDAFAIANTFDENSNPIILEITELDPDKFPHYDNPNYEHITLEGTLDLNNNSLKEI